MEAGYQQINAAAMANDILTKIDSSMSKKHLTSVARRVRNADPAFKGWSSLPASKLLAKLEEWASNYEIANGITAMDTTDIQAHEELDAEVEQETVTTEGTTEFDAEMETAPEPKDEPKAKAEPKPKKLSAFVLVAALLDANPDGLTYSEIADVMDTLRPQKTPNSSGNVKSWLVALSKGRTSDNGWEAQADQAWIITELVTFGTKSLEDRTVTGSYYNAGYGCVDANMDRAQKLVKAHYEG